MPICTILNEFGCRRWDILFEEVQTYHYKWNIVDKAGDDTNDSAIDIDIVKMSGHEVADKLQGTALNQCSDHQRNTKEIKDEPHADELSVADVLMLDEQTVTVALERKCTLKQPDECQNTKCAKERWQFGHVVERRNGPKTCDTNEQQQHLLPRTQQRIIAIVTIDE